MVRRYCKIFFLFLTLLLSRAAFAQSDTVAGGSDTVKMTADALPESAYQLTIPQNTKTIYNIHFSGVIFTILVLGMIYISYRYWADNRQKPDNNNPPNTAG